MKSSTTTLVDPALAAFARNRVAPALASRWLARFQPSTGHAMAGAVWSSAVTPSTVTVG